MSVKAIAINCSLKKSSGEPSSTDAMIALLREKFSNHDVEITETLRIADYNVLPGVTSDEGDGDDWPELRTKILAHDILIFGGPIWMGQIGSIAKRVLERMDAFLGETDDKGRMPSYGKIAVAAIVGNEDGAHWSSAQDGRHCGHGGSKCRPSCQAAQERALSRHELTFSPPPSFPAAIGAAAVRYTRSADRRP